MLLLTKEGEGELSELKVHFPRLRQTPTIKRGHANHKQTLHRSLKSRQNKQCHAWINPKLNALFIAATILLHPYETLIAI